MLCTNDLPTPILPCMSCCLMFISPKCVVNMLTLIKTICLFFIWFFFYSERLIFFLAMLILFYRFRLFVFDIKSHLNFWYDMLSFHFFNLKQFMTSKQNLMQITWTLYVTSFIFCIFNKLNNVTCLRFFGQHSYNGIRLNQIKSYFTILTFNVLISVHVQQHASLKQRLLMQTKGLSTTERST